MNSAFEIARLKLTCRCSNRIVRESNDSGDTMATSKSSKSYPFEKSLEKLEQLVERMEQGDLSLEDSLKTFEEGIKLTRECQQALAKAEQKVKMLIEENGAVSEAGFEPDDGED